MILLAGEYDLKKVHIEGDEQIAAIVASIRTALWSGSF